MSKPGQDRERGVLGGGVIERERVHSIVPVCGVFCHPHRRRATHGDPTLFVTFEGVVDDRARRLRLRLGGNDEQKYE